MFEADLEMASAMDPSLPGRLLTDNSDEYDIAINLRNKKWSHRCQQICRMTQAVTCGLFGTISNMQDIGCRRGPYKFFHHNGFLDVVPSDAVAGILLVRLQQRSFFQQHTANAQNLHGFSITTANTHDPAQ